MPAHEAYALPSWVNHPRREAAALAPVLGVRAARLLALLRSRLPYVVLSPKPLSPSATAAVEDLALPGVGVERSSYRLYPEGDLAANVLGFVSPADGLGLGGVEDFYNRELAGRAGRETVTVDAAGNPLPSFGARIHPAHPGDGLQLTLDATLEAFAESALRRAVRKDHLRAGRIIVLDPRDGAILALAEWPTFNPNDWTATPLADTNDSAVQNDYPPGSTMKPLTLAAALLDHVVGPGTIFDDTGSIVIDGRLLHDWNIVGFGRIDLAHAVAYSSDIAFMEIGLRLGKARFYRDVLQRFFLDRPAPVDLPGAAAPILPPEATARRLDVAEMAFGQTLSLPPISLAAALASIADGGVWHEPHVAEALVTPSGRRIPLRFPARRVLPRAVADEVARLMVGVIRYGTGVLARIPGYVLAGKTGTAELPVNGTYQGHYMASFVGFGPMPHPRLLVLVQLNDPKGAYYGGDIAAPVFREVMQEALAYLGIPPSTTPPAPKAVVPAVTGDPLPTAEAALQGAGFVALPVGTGPRVQDEYPPAGTSIPVGAAVSLDFGQVAAGRVPSVLGLPVRAAAALLDRHGYRLVPEGSGLAVKETPAVGTPLPEGGAVRVRFQEPP